MKNRLEEIREQKSVTQEELARQMEVSRKTICSIEAGRYNPSIILASKLARYFEMNIEEIFIFEEDLKRGHKSTKIIPALLIISGLILVIAGFVLDFNNIVGESVYSAIRCFGVPLFVLGCKDYWNACMDPDKYTDSEIERHDERNIQILNKAGYISFIFTLFSLFLFASVSIDLGYKLPSKLTFGLAVMSFGVLLVSYWYYKRRQ